MTSDVLRKLGKVIKDKANVKYKTKIDFAFECDVDERTIRRILKGEQNISV
ncbi:MAG TPA: hypothetical protein PLI68_00280 [Bacteroidia bacterium]|nr:hypothetical protein [Bacteroidia bacterium]HRH61735.1 hypothetical protein [Bacteroidia bacterium]